MIDDILTIIWKEWKELFLRRGSARSGWFNILIMVGVLGVLMPYQTGSEWLQNPLLPLVWSWLPIFLTINIVADAFAGERERHTLETLLASRLSDRAILLGKIAAAVTYGWSIAVVSMLVGAVTVNVAFPGDGIQFYSGWGFPLGVTLSFLAATLIAAVGTLVSLNAPTARAAYQRLSMVVMAVWLLPTVGISFLPDEVTGPLFASLSNINLLQVILGVGAAFLIADVVLILATLARFRRNRLILE
jgi:ABC-2 type transport system permease protein